MLKKLNRRTFVIIVAVVAVIAVVGTSLAWFSTNSSLSQNFSIFGFKVSADVYFANGNEKVSADKFKDKDGFYTLSTDEKDENYVGKLRVNVAHSGGKSLVRVKMNYMLTNSDGSPAQYKVAVPYEFNSEWFDNRNEDYCIYYKGSDGSGKAAFKNSELITGFDSYGFDNSEFPENVSAKVLIQVDSVQVNRYPQIWNIDTLPWK